MAINCNSKNPLQRDGTSQAQRTLKSLLPGYVAVDERNMEDLKAFVKTFAKEIAYYNLSNELDADPLKQDWFAFFDKEIDKGSQYNTPHFVLFLAFLDLFKHAQDEINKITKKHLDFYYRDVLHFTENPEIPDQVYLIFELAKHVTTALLEKETQFKAGKDALGNKVSYQLEEESSLNIAVISELKAVFTNKHDIFKDLIPSTQNDYRLYVSPDADSEDGAGADLTNEEKSWRTFGGIQFPDILTGSEDATEADRAQAEIGFAFASPILFLAEGERIITFYLNFSGSKSLLKNLTEKELSDAFRIKFSGVEEWIEPEWEISTGSSEMDSIKAKRILAFINKADNASDLTGKKGKSVGLPKKKKTGKSKEGKFSDIEFDLTVAARIIAERNKLPGKKFTSLKQIKEIKHLGKNKIDKMFESFGDPAHFVKVDKPNNRIIIQTTLIPDQDAVVAYNMEALLDPFETKWPVAKILLNTEGKSNPYIYEALKKLEIESADIVVDVREIKNLVIQNDKSVLDPGKPFQPFGNRPLIGSNFYIGSQEIFQKAITELNIELKWFGLPDIAKGFHKYYKNYYPETPARNNSSFTVATSLLDKKEWVPVTPDANYLFSPQSNSYLIADHNIIFSNSDPDDMPPDTLVGNVERDVEMEEFDEFDQTSRKGFIRLVLQGTDFGHKDYGTSYTKTVLLSIGTSLGTVTDYTGDLPKEPYTPEIEELKLNYISAEEINITDVSEEDHKERIEQFFHVHPTGVGEIDTQESSNFLFPQYDNEGELYLGIKDLVPAQNLSVLFQVSEGSSNPDISPPGVEWSYLSKNKWVPFPDQNILTDSTKGLITTGVVQFSVPSLATKTNTILTKGLYWIKAAVEKDSEGIPQLIDIKCQAAKALFDENDNDPEYLSKPMPEKTISKLVVADSSIKKIEQPFTSFGGKVKEESGSFYTRVSERLRHKNRSITIWDYEHIILQNFPSVYKVKCLNHTNYTGTFSSINEASPCHVSLIIVSNIRNKNGVDPLKPRTSLVMLYDIDEFIDGIRSPYINVHVHNPLFEEVKVKFNVKFYEGIDSGIYEKKLEESIVQFLSPWAYETGSDIVFGGNIHKSVILNFVEEQPYVDFVTCFEMFHIVPDDPDNNPEDDIEEAIASTSASILGSSKTHSISVLETDDCECPENEVTTVEIASAGDCP